MWTIRHSSLMVCAMHMSPPLAHDTRGFVLLPPYTVLFCSPHSHAPKDIRKGDWEMICWLDGRKGVNEAGMGVSVDLGWESELEDEARMGFGVDWMNKCSCFPRCSWGRSAHALCYCTYKCWVRSASVWTGYLTVPCFPGKHLGSHFAKAF